MEHPLIGSRSLSRVSAALFSFLQSLVIVEYMHDDHTATQSTVHWDCRDSCYSSDHAIWHPGHHPTKSFPQGRVHDLGSLGPVIGHRQRIPTVWLALFARLAREGLPSMHDDDLDCPLLRPRSTYGMVYFALPRLASPLFLRHPCALEHFPSSTC